MMEQIGNELSFEEQITLVDQAVEMGCNKFVFSGGEPLIYGPIFDLIGYCPKTSYVSIITNASHLDISVIKRLDSIEQFRELKISLDGFSSHNYIRLGSQSAQVIDAISETCTTAPRLNIIINTMMNKYSACELCHLYKCLKEFGINHWRIDMPFNAGRCVENVDLMNIPFVDIISVYRDLLKQYFADGKPMALELFNVYKSMMDTDTYYEFDDRVHPCAYYNNTITVRPNGDLTYCPSLSVALSNWRSAGNLEDAEACALRHDYCNLSISQISECSGCRYIKLCGAGCRADAITWGNGQTGPDPINCSLMPLVEEHILPILPNTERAMYEHYIDPSKQMPCSFASAVAINGKA